MVKINFEMKKKMSPLFEINVLMSMPASLVFSRFASFYNTLIFIIIFISSPLSQNPLGSI